MPTPTARRAAWLPIALLTACAPIPPAAPVAPVAPAIAAASAPTPAAPAAPASAASAPAGAGEPVATSVPIEPGEIIESARETVRSTAVWLASGLDSWFGERTFEEGGKVYDGQLDLTVLKRQRARAEVDVRVNAKFHLPNIDRLAYIFVGRDSEREAVTDRPSSLSRQDQLRATRSQDRTFLAGLGRTFDDLFDFRIGVHGGFKPYVQARARHRWDFGSGDRVDARQTLFWTVDDRFGSTSALSYEHDITTSLATRWVGAATITQDLPKFVWASSLGAYQSFGDQRLLALETLVNGQQGSGVGALDYGVQTRWEQPVYQDWLIGGVLVGRFWPRPDPLTERRGAWALGLNLKMRF